MKLALRIVPLFLLAAGLGVGCANEKTAAKPAGPMNVGSGTPAAAVAPVAASPVAVADPAPVAPRPEPAAAAIPAAPSKAVPSRSAAATPSAAGTPVVDAAAGDLPAKPAAAKPLTAAKSSATAKSTAGAGESYVVQKGDTLTKIARDKYGDGAKWKRIAEANPGVTPGTIKVGQKLVIPTI